jgi:hypothetical protein
MPSAETAADELRFGTALGVSAAVRRVGEDWGEGRGGGILSILGPTFHSLGVALSSPDMEGRFGCYGVFDRCAETAVRDASTSGRVQALAAVCELKKCTSSLSPYALTSHDAHKPTSFEFK